MGEALNVDFAAEDAGIDTDGWQEALLRHLVEKADRMGVAASVDVRLASMLDRIVNQQSESIGKRDGERRGRCAKVKEVRHRLVLRPSNGVLEASDYLSHKHDWVQMEVETTE